MIEKNEKYGLIRAHCVPKKEGVAKTITVQCRDRARETRDRLCQKPDRSQHRYEIRPVNVSQWSQMSDKVRWAGTLFSTLPGLLGPDVAGSCITVFRPNQPASYRGGA